MRWTLPAALALSALASAPLPAQQADFPVDAAYRARILDAVASRVGKDYFDAKLAAAIRSRLSKRAVRAAYDSCATAASLSTALTQDLRSWSRDRHLQLVFSSEPRPLAGPGASAGTGEDAERGAARNFGFYSIQRFTGNVGYLELGRFEPAALAGATLQAAMQLLANTDALIIDLRQNGGGHADMVSLITSYFIGDQMKLATLERRDALAPDQIWSAAYVPGPKYLGRPVYLLTSNRTFSAAEGLTYDLRYFAHATVVGEKTRGGANPGAFQQIDEHFAVFVPTARVVHAATGTNWDADGIAPDVAVPAKDASRAALKLALERLMADRPADRRFAMWKEAHDDMFASTR